MEEDQAARDERMKAHIDAMMATAEKEIMEDESWGECSRLCFAFLSARDQLYTC